MTYRLLAILSLTLLLSSVLRGTDLEVHFLAVGQGDCTLVKFPNGKSMLVDCGSTGGIYPFDMSSIQKFIKTRLPGPEPTLDFLLITHPDADHYNKVASVLGFAPDAEIGVSQVLLARPPEEHIAGRMKEWLEDRPQGSVKVLSPSVYNDFPAKRLPGFGAVNVSILATGVSTDGNKNTASTVLLLEYGSVRVLLPGDATAATMRDILRRYAGNLGALDVDVLKGEHHGSWSTALQNGAWARAVKPEVLILSAGAGNDYGHPNHNMLDLFVPYTRAFSPHPVTAYARKHVPAAPELLETYSREAILTTIDQGNISLFIDGQNVRKQFQRTPSSDWTLPKPAMWLPSVQHHRFHSAR